MNSAPIVVVEHDPAWVTEFEALRDVLGNCLGELVDRIEHVGSTAIPGLAAKPVIDIDVLVADQDFDRAAARLKAVGYEHIGDLGVLGREAFSRVESDVPRDGSGRKWLTHHLYVCRLNSIEWRRHVAFRDELRRSPDDAARYQALKLSLAKRFRHDRDAYSRGKAQFVEEILCRHDLGH